MYGTVRRGAYRRYETTEVLDQWITVKPAFRVDLEDGTELVTSGDHRFLIGPRLEARQAPAAAGQRPYLTTNNKLLGTGAFAVQPRGVTATIVRGYLCGLIRGDAHLGDVPVRNAARVHHFRLALADLEALARTRALPGDVGRHDRRVPVRGAPPARIARCGRSARSAATRRRDPRADRAGRGSRRSTGRKGFLAGIFDAEGSLQRRALRISNGDRGRSSTGSRRPAPARVRRT